MKGLLCPRSYLGDSLNHGTCQLAQVDTEYSLRHLTEPLKAHGKAPMGTHCSFPLCLSSSDSAGPITLTNGWSYTTGSWGPVLSNDSQ